MATGAAWLNRNRLTETRKRKCALTSTGLLMEGLGQLALLIIGSADQSGYAMLMILPVLIWFDRSSKSSQFSMRVWQHAERSARHEVALEQRLSHTAVQSFFVPMAASIAIEFGSPEHRRSVLALTLIGK